jgi:hypothetical protein
MINNNLIQSIKVLDTNLTNYDTKYPHVLDTKYDKNNNKFNKFDKKSYKVYMINNYKFKSLLISINLPSYIDLLIK